MSIYKLCKLTAVAFTFFFSTATVMAVDSTSLNEVHSCLTLVKFVHSKIETATYSADQKSMIKKGLYDYSIYLDHDVITPKLLNMYGGNATQANLMKKLFSRQQAKFAVYLSDRYAERKLESDYAVAIKTCSIKTRTVGDVALSLTRAVNTMENR